MKTIRPAERRSLFLSAAPAKKPITAKPTAKPQPQPKRPQVEQTPPCKRQAELGSLFLSTAPTKKKSIKPAGKPKQQQPRRKQKRHEVEQLSPRKRQCPSEESSVINIYTPLSPELFSFPTLPVLSADDDDDAQTTTETVDTAQLQQLLMDEEIRLVRMLRDAKREELRQIQAYQNARLELQSRSLMDNLLSTTGIRRVVNDCVFEPMYK
jgi:hypothetical protein